MKDRICYLCEKDISFEDCCIVNKNTKELERQWESKYTEYMCCGCFNLINEIKNGPSNLYNLLEWAENGRILKLKKLGILCREDLIELERLKNEG